MRRCWVRVVFVSFAFVPAIFGECTLDVKTGGAPPVEINKRGAPCSFLQFAWRAFLAENWPPLPVNARNTTRNARGLPDARRIIGQSGDNPTVWQQFQPNWYLFEPNNPPPLAAGGQSFAAWNQNPRRLASCGRQAASTPGTMVLTSLTPEMPGVSRAFASPLIDGRGYYARYDIRLSYEAFNYINSNRYYLQSGQTPATAFSFPVQRGSTPGAIFVKSAWKILSATEIGSGRFHTAQAFLFTPAPFVQSCVGPVTVGLVGLHIVQKTAAFPRYLWATFEQVDNTPADPAHAPAQTWSFFNPSSSAIPDAAPTCPNTLSAVCDWQPAGSHLDDKTGGPTQVVRKNPIPESPNQPALGQINVSVQAGLKAINPTSVWQFYELVDAQWQSTRTATGFFPPGNVLNAVVETYFQSSMSCMACHLHATAFNGKLSDFTFELGLEVVGTPAATSGLAQTPAISNGGPAVDPEKSAGGKRSNPVFSGR